MTIPIATCTCGLRLSTVAAELPARWATHARGCQPYREYLASRMEVMEKRFTAAQRDKFERFEAVSDPAILALLAEDVLEMWIEAHTEMLREQLDGSKDLGAVAAAESGR